MHRIAERRGPDTPLSHGEHEHALIEFAGPATGRDAAALHAWG